MNVTPLTQHQKTDTFGQTPQAQTTDILRSFTGVKRQRSAHTSPAPKAASSTAGSRKMKKRAFSGKSLHRAFSAKTKAVIKQSEQGIRSYTFKERTLMSQVFQIFEFIGDSELHIERLRIKLAKDPKFESYNCYRMLGGKLTSQQIDGVDFRQIYDFLIAN